ncbi:hypothetical protein Cyrtocomes_00392 [Candidatus Cyrtobacter comes]|uniref:Uncharacterized protein n=1 Tax=Candidatus Cyrtobacter comes TaxID=675776 RepID=A0ABU5L7C5_9RICK|nr:hypothetical protein [Candidatus Cyrtobacter comes]MDZ5762026.1 hypothetical protein [Candidatus Cyrtobacter comes]
MTDHSCNSTQHVYHKATGQSFYNEVIMLNNADNTGNSNHEYAQKLSCQDELHQPIAECSLLEETTA